MLFNTILFFVKYGLLIVLSLFDIDWIKFIAIILPLLFSVAFFTIFERKVLGGMQRRRGPNVVGYLGMLQAVADAIKFLAKETVIPSSANIIIFALAPLFTMLFAVMAWSVIPMGPQTVIMDSDIGLLIIFAISTLSLFSIIMAGWASNSKYAFLGALRSAAQLISYEIALGLIVMPVVILSNSLNLTTIVAAQRMCWHVVPLLYSFMLFFICLLAETSRVPFDLPEAESELVSGYNVEYSSVGFVLFFLAEYLNIIMMCALAVLLFFGGWLPPIDCDLLWLVPRSFWFSAKTVALMYVVIWVRAVLPRYRYDQLMSLGWKVILPIALGMVVFTLCMYLLIKFHICIGLYWV